MDRWLTQCHRPVLVAQNLVVNMGLTGIAGDVDSLSVGNLLTRKVTYLLSRPLVDGTTRLNFAPDFTPDCY